MPVVRPTRRQGLIALPGEEDLDALALPRPGASFWFIGFDMLKPDSPTARSPALRRALDLAIDRDELNAAVGFAGPEAGSPIPPGVPGHDSELASNFDPDAPSYLNQFLPQGSPIVKGDVDLMPPRVRNNLPLQRNNFAPRIGLAYGLTPTTIVRSGYGITQALESVSEGAAVR